MASKFFFNIAFNLVIPKVIDFLFVGVFFYTFYYLFSGGNIFVVILLFEILKVYLHVLC